LYAFAQPSPAPGGNPAPAQPSTQAPSSPDAPPAGGGGFGSTGMLLVMALPLLLLIFMTRNQSKKQKQLEESLKVGDRVVTQSGLIGKIVDMGERTAKIEIAPGVNVQMLKSTIQGPEPPAADAKASASKDTDKGKDAPKTDAKEKK
jgi:preprotein translocase subunit YajC